MKKISLIVLFQLALLSSFVAPLTTAQESCEIDQGLRELVEKTFSRWSSQKPKDRGIIYVSHLSFIDGITRTQLLSPEMALIEEALKDLVQTAADMHPDIFLNEPGHTIPNDDTMINRLIDISFNPELTPVQKYQEAVSTLLDPHGVDVLVSGVVIDTGAVVVIKLMGVSKPDEVIRSRDRSFPSREELFQRVNGTLALTDKGREEIAKAASELLESL